jgi:hypothetical protein
MKLFPSILLWVALMGCSADVHTIYVTHDPRFQSGYRQGQIYRLKTDGYLVQYTAGGSWELWTRADLANQQVTQAIPIPAGSTVRIDELGYLYNSEHPSIPGGTTQVVLAYGTVTTPDGKQWPTPVTILPARTHPHPVEGTSLLVYPADGEFLESNEPLH